MVWYKGNPLRARHTPQAQLITPNWGQTYSPVHSKFLDATTRASLPAAALNGNTLSRCRAPYTSLYRYLPTNSDEQITSSDICTTAGTDSTSATVYKPPHPQHLPSQTEIEYTRLRIHNSQTHILSIDKRLEDARDLIKQLASEREELESVFLCQPLALLWHLTRQLRNEIANNKSFIAPIRRLPFEILGELFLAYIDIGGSPWELTRICKSWRLSAINTPRLWSRIHVALQPLRNRYPTPPALRWSKSGEYCDTPERLERALRRAGATPLDLVLELRETDGWLLPLRSVMGDERQKTLEALLKLISGERMVQWKSVLLIASAPLPLGYLEGNLERLESFEMDWRGGTDEFHKKLLDSIDQTSMNLRMLKFTGGLPVRYMERTWWNRLTELCLDSVTRQNLPSLLCQCVKLVKLTLGLSFSTEAATITEVNVPTLRELILSSCDMANLSNLLLPQLETLVLRHCADGPPGACLPAPAKLTNLLKLTLDSTEINILGHIVAPKLEELELRFSRVPYKKQVTAALKAFNSRVTQHPALRVLKITNALVPDAGLKTMLEMSPNLTHLMLSGALGGRKILDTLAAKNKSKRKGWLCPILTTLEIDYTPSTKKMKEAPLETLRPAVEGLIAARMQGKPLEHVWYNGYGNLVEPDEKKRVDKWPGKFAAPVPVSSLSLSVPTPPITSLLPFWYPDVDFDYDDSFADPVSDDEFDFMPWDYMF